MIDLIRKIHNLYKHKQDYHLKFPALPVKYLIFFDDDPHRGAFIVFLDFDCDLDWHRDPDADKYAIEKGFEAEASKTANAVAELEPAVRNWPKDLRISARRALGECLARALCNQPDNAKDALRRARAFIKQKSQEVSRFWTLRAAGIVSLVSAIAGLATLYFRGRLNEAFGEVCTNISLAFDAGTVGALLSIILRIGKINFDASAERRLHYAEGIARTVAGGIAGMLAGAMVRLGVLFPIFTRAGMMTTAICTVALIAGASERWVPAIIGKFEANGDLDQQGDS